MKSSQTPQDAEQLFQKAINYRDANKLKLAVKTFEEFIKLYPKHNGLAVVFTVLGGIYQEQNNLSRAILYFKRAIKLRPNYELASQCFYVASIENGKYASAMKELSRFLENNKAKHYKVTLRELIGDLKNGSALKWKDLIVQLAKKNGVSVRGVK